MPVEVHLITALNTHLLDDIADGVFATPVLAKFLTSYCADPTQSLFVALRDGQVVGQLKSALHRHPDKPANLFIEELAIAPDQRRQGIASRLVAAASAHGDTQGCAELWLATEPGNTAANALYRQVGMNAQHVVMYSWLLAEP